jgi:hypothetical protein
METLKENNNKTSDLTTIPLVENPPINNDYAQGNRYGQVSKPFISQIQTLT